MKRLTLEALANRWCPHAGHHEPYEPEPAIPVPEIPTEPPAFVGPLPGTSPVTPPTPPVTEVVGPQPGSTPTTPPVVELPVEPTPSPILGEPHEEPTEEHHEEESATEVHESRMSVDGAVMHLHAFTGVTVPTMGTPHNTPHDEDTHEATHDSEHVPQHQNANSTCGHGSAPMYFVGVHNTHRTPDIVASEEDAHIEPEHAATTRQHQNRAVSHTTTWPTDMQPLTYEPTTETLPDVQEPIEVLPESIEMDEFPTVELVATNRLQRVLGWCSLSMGLLWAARTVQTKQTTKLRPDHATK